MLPGTCGTTRWCRHFLVCCSVQPAVLCKQSRSIGAQLVVPKYHDDACSPPPSVGSGGVLDATGISSAYSSSLRRPHMRPTDTMRVCRTTTSTHLKTRAS